MRLALLHLELTSSDRLRLRLLAQRALRICVLVVCSWLGLRLLLLPRLLLRLLRCKALQQPGFERLDVAHLTVVCRFCTIEP